MASALPAGLAGPPPPPAQEWGVGAPSLAARHGAAPPSQPGPGPSIRPEGSAQGPPAWRPARPPPPPPRGAETRILLSVNVARTTGTGSLGIRATPWPPGEGSAHAWPPAATSGPCLLSLDRPVPAPPHHPRGPQVRAAALCPLASDPAHRAGRALVPEAACGWGQGACPSLQGVRPGPHAIPRTHPTSPSRRGTPVRARPPPRPAGGVEGGPARGSPGEGTVTACWRAPGHELNYSEIPEPA